MSITIVEYFNKNRWLPAAENLSVVGFDIAPVSTGWVSIKSGYCEFGVWKRPEELPLAELHDQTAAMLRVQEPCLIAVEDMTYGKSYESFGIGAATGAVMSAVEGYKKSNLGRRIGILRINPIRLKSYLVRHKVSSAEGKKISVDKMFEIIQTHGYDPEKQVPKDKRSREDIADAFHIAIMGIIAWGIHDKILDNNCLQPDVYRFFKNGKDGIADTIRF